MKRNHIAGFALLAVISTIATLLIIFQIPVLAQTQVERTLNEIGFTPLNTPTPQAKFGALLYKNIALDKDEFSTIQTLKIEYNWLHLLLFKDIRKITIDGLNLTGEIDRAKKISLAGWNGKIKNTLFSRFFRIKSIHFKNTQLSLMSKKYGGISLQYEGEINQNKTGITFQGRLNTTQKQMRQTLNITGQLNKDLTWYSNIEIKNLHLKTPHIKIARANGTLTITKDQHSIAQMNGEIHAGQILLEGFPWTKTAITIEGTTAKPSIILGAKASGHEDTELGLSIEDLFTPARLSGYIYSKTPTALIDYANQNSAMTLSPETIMNLGDLLKTLVNTEITFEKYDNDTEISIKSKSEHNPPLEFEAFMQTRPTENGPLTLHAAALKSKNAGTLKITNPAFFNLLQNPKEEQTTLKKALKNFSYEQIILQTKTSDDKAYKFKLDIKGPTEAFSLTFEEKPSTLINILMKPE